MSGAVQHIEVEGGLLLIGKPATVNFERPIVTVIGHGETEELRASVTLSFIADGESAWAALSPVTARRLAAALLAAVEVAS